MDSKPRRGRKPKNNNTIIKKEKNIQNPIIVHLPIEFKEEEYNNNDIFIQQSDDKKIIKELKSKVKQLTKQLENIKTDDDNSKVFNTSINSSENNYKCWWCRYNFCSPVVELPEQYFNEKFYCSGIFCSYNCALAFNIDMNDENVSKRTSLLHFHYKKTYNKYININPAPSWKILKEAGGCIEIDDYRNNFYTNLVDYKYIKPPMISHIAQIEKKSKTKKVVKKNELVLKRSKPLNTSKYTLESTMGLKIIASENNS